MKKFTVFESSIIGLFIGVITATYVVFLSSTGGFVGRILGGISLLPLLDSFDLPVNQLAIPFIFIVIVFVIYGILVGLLIKAGRKTTIAVVALLVLLPSGIVLEQSLVAPAMKVAEVMNVPIMAAVIRAVPKAPEQYFGNEVKGDLNGDTKEDVAFVITRADKERGMLYYLVASIATDAGHAGSNLLFLGDKVEPKRIGIESGIIFVDYIDHTSKKLASTTKHFYAELVNGELKEVKLPVSSDKNLVSASSTQKTKLIPVSATSTKK